MIRLTSPSAVLMVLLLLPSGSVGQPAAEPHTRAEPAAQQSARKNVQGSGSDVVFAENAFPPTIPDTDWHRNAWLEFNCLRCHETGVGKAPVVVHSDLPPILLSAKCRSCHVLIPGSAPKAEAEPERGTPSPFAENAFPPMMPNSESHMRAWTKDDCLLCHESGIHGAPIILHEDLPAILLKAKCRSCHVQVRAVETVVPGP